MIHWLAAASLAAPEASAQRDRPGDVMPERRWDFEHLDLDLRVDVDEGTVAGTATWTARRLGTPSAWLSLDQAGLEITEVKLDGKTVEGWRVAGERLDVPVPPDRAAAEIAVTYTARPQTGLHFRGDRGEVREVWSQGEGEDNRHWYPGWDYPNDKFTVRTTLEVAPDLVALANGVLEGTEAAPDGWKRWTYHLDRPIVNYLVAITVGDYEVHADEARIPLEYVVTRGVGEEVARRTLGRTPEQLVYLEGLLGEPYPYDVYRQVLVQRFLYGGMENATLTTLTDDLLVGEHDLVDRTDSVVAHELAHQWFGDLLTCYGWRELWLNEGFATFYAGRWQESDQGEAKWAQLLRGWQAAALHTRDAPMAARAHTKVDGRENAAVYVKGASVLAMLRVHLGDDVFDAAVRRYVAENRDRLVESEDLRRAFEDESGQHLGWLFDQWVTGTGVAKLKASHAFDGAALEVAIEQQTEGTAFTAPVRVEIGLPDRSVERLVWVGPGTARLVAELDEAPLYVAVDPSGGVLAEWDRAQTVAEWAAQARHARRPYARLVAIARLGDGKPDDEAVAALIELASAEGEPRAIREAALGALGETLHPDAVAPLERALGSDAAELRAAAASALGELGRDEGLRALLRAARGDDSPRVRAHALHAVATLDPDEARGIARAWLGRPDPSFGGRLHRAAADVLGEEGSPGELAALLPKIADDAPAGVLAAAAEAAISLVADLDEDDPERARLARRLDPLLASRSIRTRSSAISWLGRAGDEQSERALVAFAKHNRVTWGELSERALDAARLIRSRGGRDDAPPGSDDLERLKQRLEALEGRISDLEKWR